MRVLLPARPGGAWGYITDGMYNVFRLLGHEVIRWDGQENTWNDFAPDLYIGCSGHLQPIPRARNAKVAIHANPYGPVNIEGINESPQVIEAVARHNPDAVFGYGFEKDRILWSYWKEKLGIKWVPFPTAADTSIFKQVVDARERSLDLVYLGGRWAYKGLSIDAFLKPILMKGNVSYKLHGWGDWYPGVCSGILPEDKACEFLNTGKVGPCISERHTQVYGIDIPERCWKIPACGVLAIHDPVPGLKDVFPSCLVAGSPEEMMELVYYYSRPENTDERCEVLKLQQECVLRNHTYFHRIYKLLTELGFSEEAGKIKPWL